MKHSGNALWSIYAKNGLLAAIEAIAIAIAVTVRFSLVVNIAVNIFAPTRFRPG
jgi:hypothetical protein